MRYSVPISLLLFVLAGLVYRLQTNATFGVIMMMLAAPFWSILLINGGMIGIAVEASNRLIPRAWLVIPLLFYGGYFAFAAADHIALRQLGSAVDSANAQVTVPYSSTRETLVFEDHEDQQWLTGSYAIPVTYSVNANFDAGFISNRLVDRGLCDAVRSNSSWRAAGVRALGISGENLSGDGKSDDRFCNLSMPEAPVLPQVRVSQREERTHYGLLPVRMLTTTVIRADRKRFTLRGGTAAPLRWFPMPVMGCALNSSAPAWNCFATFMRDRFVPIASGKNRYNRDAEVLAQTLQLPKIPIDERKVAEPSKLVLSKIEGIEQAVLSKQTSEIDAMIADPLGAEVKWQMDVLSQHPQVLSMRADGLMAGVELAARAPRDNHRSREAGLVFARLLAKLPEDRFRAITPRLEALYREADHRHWLWTVGPLQQRLVDFAKMPS